LSRRTRFCIVIGLLLAVLLIASRRRCCISRGEQRSRSDRCASSLCDPDISDHATHLAHDERGPTSSDPALGTHGSSRTDPKTNPSLAIALSLAARLRTVFGKIGLPFAVLSVVKLWALGLHVGLKGPFAAILTFYQTKFVDPLLGWAEPLLRFILTYVAVNLHLHNHWKYMFVPMWLYFGADARTYWHRRQQRSAIVTLIWGGLIALSASIASGVTSLDDPAMLPLVFPVAGFIIYEIGQAASDATLVRTPQELSSSSRASVAKNQSWFQTFQYYILRLVLTNAVIGTVVYLIGLHARQTRLPFPTWAS
jgi:hypothetical protein